MLIRTARSTPRCVVTLSMLVLLLGLAALDAEEAASGPAAPRIDAAKEIAPLFERHCLRCHKPDQRAGDLSLATPADLLEAELLVPGDAEASYLLEVVTSHGGKRPDMPKDGDPLSADEIALVSRWIQEGAAWPEGLVLREQSKADASFWSLQPLASVVPPVTESAPDEWQAQAIDRFIYARLATEGLAPNPPADPRTLIRRATFDLTGLPPTPAEVAAFVADHSPEAYANLIDRLLASPAYGEHWGRHWLDVVRFGESRGYERNQIIKNLWPFRDYVIRSIQADKPFDQFIREHLAGDVVAADDPEREVGVAFLVAGPYDDVGNQDPVKAAQIRADTIDEMIRATGEAFLGLTVGCARCHDHKFDPIVAADYYRFYAAFAGVRHGERPISTAAAREERSAKLKPLVAAQKKLESQRKELETAIQTASAARAAEIEATWKRPKISRQRTEEGFLPVEAKQVRLVVLSQEKNLDTATNYRIDEFEIYTADEESANVALASAGATAAGASRTANDFQDAYGPKLTIDGQYGVRWIASGPELTITLAEPQLIDRVVFSSDRNDVAQKNDVALFVAEYEIQVSLDGKAWTTVAASHDRQPVSAEHRQRRLQRLATSAEDQAKLADIDRQLTGVRKEIAAVPNLPSWWVGKMEPAPGPFPIFIGGDPQRKGTPVEFGGVAVLEDVVPPFSLAPTATPEMRRQALADWLVQPSHPLTWRVLANRIWHYHFGTGIVDTPSDFGYMGGRPTHPELLDWLTGELVRGGYRLKPLHRAIMLSQTYQQTSTHREAAARLDADSRLLWRFPPRRLTAEAIRDAMLLAAGKLDRRQGGPGFQLYRYLQDNVSTYIPLEVHGPETYRRAVYHHTARAAPVDLLADFDAPDCAFSTPRRATTTTPLQALALYNHRFTLDMSMALAARIECETAAGDVAAQVRQAFQHCFGRDPSEAEHAACLRVAQEHGLRAVCRVLFNANEFIQID